MTSTSLQARLDAPEHARAGPAVFYAIASDAIQQLRRLEGEVERLRWQPIPKLPFSLDDDAPFAVMNSNGYCGCATYVHSNSGAYYHTAEEEVQICSGVTHWMPLPEPPPRAGQEGY